MLSKRDRPGHTAARTAGLTVLLSEAGSATREVRITLKTASACLLIVGAILGVGLWLGWELGDWSAKNGSSLANVCGLGPRVVS